MRVEEVITNGKIAGYKHYTDDWGIPCDKSEAGCYNYVEVDANGKPIRDVECIIGRLDDPNRKKSKPFWLG